VRDAVAPGGLSRVATALETLRARYPGTVVLVDAGDLLQGNPFATFFGRYDKRQPQPIVDAMNALQYDAVTPGNHDFDFGLPFAAARSGRGDLPLRIGKRAGLDGHIDVCPDRPGAARPHQSRHYGIDHAGRDAVGPQPAGGPRAGAPHRRNGAGALARLDQQGADLKSC